MLMLKTDSQSSHVMVMSDFFWKSFSISCSFKVMLVLLVSIQQFVH